MCSIDHPLFALGAAKTLQAYAKLWNDADFRVNLFHYLDLCDRLAVKERTTLAAKMPVELLDGVIREVRTNTDIIRSLFHQSVESTPIVDRLKNLQRFYHTWDWLRKGPRDNSEKNDKDLLAIQEANQTIRRRVYALGEFPTFCSLSEYIEYTEECPEKVVAHLQEKIDNPELFETVDPNCFF